MDQQSANSGPNQGVLKRRLGRGLNALLGGMETDEQAPATSNPSVAAPESDEIHLELIERNPFQPRQEFEKSSLDELADSIRRHGILQPILVRPRPGDESGYQIIAGERRWRAAQQAGLEAVPCRVINCEDQEVSEAALEENLKRQDLNVLEKASAFKDYLKRFGGTIEELGKQLSMSRSTVSNMLRLLELPQPVQDLLRSDAISAGHARAILPLSEAQQGELAEQVRKEQLSVRKTEEIVREILKSGTKGLQQPATAPKPDSPQLSNHVLSLQDHLRNQLGAKIDIRLKKNEAGQIVIHFGNNDDFERIVGRLRKVA
jgi:ParB family transcriptional regulator, chromosome partitioning protein